ncbi:hypothetical protein J3R82DRAFT_2773 [Butyriboletus roseoflavus]|nr:hypothetical protein J3R82DRAFT_3356 [Butyriboletus roseoflavus]KAG8221200.1 hypothetical protein J3R82DRAFT_2773 [Butyriboletus roseoflavus]
MDTMTPPVHWIPALVALHELSPNSSEVERRMRRPAQMWTCIPLLRMLVPFPVPVSLPPVGFHVHLPSVVRGSCKIEGHTRMQDGWIWPSGKYFWDMTSEMDSIIKPMQGEDVHMDLGCKVENGVVLDSRLRYECSE